MTRLRFAALRQEAIVEDLDLRAPRGLDRPLFQKLASGDWISRKQNLLIIGPTGVGKSWLACALGHKACRDDRSVAYHRVPRLLEALALARSDGRYARLLKAIGRVQLLILDNRGLAPLTGEQRRDLLEIMNDRRGRGSTIVTSQVPVDHWHEVRRSDHRRRLARSPRPQRSQAAAEGYSSGDGLLPRLALTSDSTLAF